MFTAEIDSITFLTSTVLFTLILPPSIASSPVRFFPILERARGRDETGCYREVIVHMRISITQILGNRTLQYTIILS